MDVALGDPWRGRRAYADHLENMPDHARRGKGISRATYDQLQRQRTAQSVRSSIQQPAVQLGLF